LSARIEIATACLLLALGGCSLSTLERSDCTSDNQCREAFGPGHGCGDDGFCRGVAAPKRCESTYPADLVARVAQGERWITFGSLFDRSLKTHQAREKAIQLALDQVNTAGGVDGTQMGMIHCTIETNEALDKLDDEQALLTSARYLQDYGVLAIIGPSSSADTQKVFQELSSMLLISPAATSPALTALDPQDVSDDKPGLLWRTVAPDSLQGLAIAQDMLGGQGRTTTVSAVAVVHETGAYGDGLYLAFAKAISQDGRIALTELPYSDESSRDQQIAAAGNGSYDEVLFIASPTSDLHALFDYAAANSSYDSKGLFLTDAAASSELLQSADAGVLARVRGTRPAPLDAATNLTYKGFIAKYSARYSDDVSQYSFTAQTYDAAWLAALGAAWAELQEGSISSVAAAKGLRKLSQGDAIDVGEIGWNTILQHFRAGQSVDVAGASGALDYDPQTEETSSAIEIWTVDAQKTPRGLYTWTP